MIRGAPSREWDFLWVFENGLLHRRERTVEVRNPNGTIRTQTFPAKWASQQTATNGYKRVKFRVDGKQHTRSVHRLVWEAFNGSIPDGYEINHINSDRSNNLLSNLELMTPQQNMKHGVLFGNKTNRTGFIGVCKRGNRYVAQAHEPQTDKRIHIGYYDTAEEAARAYNAYLIERGWHLPPHEKALNVFPD